MHREIAARELMPLLLDALTDAHVRSERDGGGNGRVYRINYSALGGSCTGFVTVIVPHDRSGRGAVDDGQIYDSTEGCR